jgi:hypothetical protein
MSKLTTAAALLAVSLIGMRAFGANPPIAAATGTPPPGPGLALINERCGFCHSTGQVFAARKSQGEWTATVQSMADRGAEVSPDEIKVIADYLGTNFGAPAAPAAHP